MKPLIISKRNLIIKIIWLIISIICFVIGLVIFLENDKSFSYWLIAGFPCCIPIVPTILKVIGFSALSGTIEGASNYTGTIEDDKIKITNHPFLGFLIGLFLGTIIGLMIGLPFLAIRIIVCIIQIIIISVKLNKIS